MFEPLARPIGATRLGKKGQLTVPPDYRRMHKLSKGSDILFIQLGDALMVVPYDLALNHLCEQIRAALVGRGISVGKALKNLAKIRRRRFQSLYGK